jgi:hypothetical protein
VLQTLRDESRRTLGEFQHFADAQVNAFDEYATKAREQADRRTHSAEQELAAVILAAQESRTKGQEALDKLHADTKERLEKVEKTYTEHMRLAAPVDYWEKQRVKHRWRALGFGCAVVGVAAGGAWFLWHQLARYLAAVDVAKSRLNPVQVGELT